MATKYEDLIDRLRASDDSICGLLVEKLMAENVRLRAVMKDEIGELRSAAGRNDPSTMFYINRYEMQRWVQKAANRLKEALKEGQWTSTA